MRKLAIAAFSFSASIFAANTILPQGVILWLAAAFAFSGLLLLMLRQKWLVGVLLALFGCAAGLLCYSLHAQRTLLPALELDGQTVEIQGRVTAYPQIYDDYARVEMVLEGEGLPPVSILLYDRGETIKTAQPGDRISCTAAMKRGDQRYGERYDAYLARDIYLTASARSDLLIQHGGFDLRAFPQRISHLFASQVDTLFPPDAAAFMKSLMLGDKQDLYRDESLYMAMNRAGFLHIVAVSGMHIAFLVGMIQFLFGKSRRSSLVCFGLLWFFVLMTGSSPSAVRAAVMQSFLLAAPLFRRENDPITSLSAALALILLVNPYAASSVSLQLSFSAMAGILCLAEPVNDYLSSLFPEHWAERLRVPLATAASSFGVMAFSVPFMVWHFGSISLLSPLTNVLGLWAVSFCFCGGYLSCLLGVLFQQAGRVAAWICSWLVRYLIGIARIVSAVPFAVLYIRTIRPILWIALVYALFWIASRSKLRKVSKLLIPFLASAGCLALLLFSMQREYSAGSGVISVVDVGQGQSIAVFSGEETVVIDCGGIHSLSNAGDTMGAYLRSCGRDHVDALLLTHLHADHCNGVISLMERVPVRRLILPAGIADADGQWDAIRSAAQKHGTQILYLTDDAQLSFGGIALQLFKPSDVGDVNDRCMILLVSLGSYDMLVTGDSSKSAEREFLQRHPLEDLELLIVGHHGSRYASSGELLGAIGADTAVISVGYNNFGHPTYETLERLNAYGYTIYRTDLNGTIEFYIGDSYG